MGLDGPSWLQDGPKTGQVEPKMGQDGPSWPQDGAKLAPRWAQDGPSSAQDRSKDGFANTGQRADRPGQRADRPGQTPDACKKWRVGPWGGRGGKS